MLSLREAFYALFGAWRLARMDASGLACFDLSAVGALRSFFALVLVLPFYLLERILSNAAIFKPADGLGPVDQLLAQVGMAHLVILYSLAAIIGWVGYALIIEQLAGQFGRAHRFTGFLAAHNWSRVLSMALWFPVALLLLSGSLSPGWAAMLWLGASGFVFVYRWFIARAALDIESATAIWIVALDVSWHWLISTSATFILMMPVVLRDYVSNLSAG